MQRGDTMGWIRGLEKGAELLEETDPSIPWKVLLPRSTLQGSRGLASQLSPLDFTS